MALREEDIKPPNNYADYLKLDSETRWEMIDGVPFCMSPSPTINHQIVTGNIHTEFNVYLRGKECSVFIAPLDVLLFADDKRDDEIKNFVQPDVFVVCDPKKLKGRCCKGSPDLVVEVLSPSTGKRDKSQKLDLYMAAGVREYWIVDPLHCVIEVFKQAQKDYAPSVYGRSDKIQVGIFDDLEIDLTNVFTYEVE